MEFLVLPANIVRMDVQRTLQSHSILQSITVSCVQQEAFPAKQVYYNNVAMSGHGKAGECIKCGKCEQACPQHLLLFFLLQ